MSYFSAAFRRTTGLSPIAYRARFGKKIGFFTRHEISSH